jgi:hypothetical protein
MPPNPGFGYRLDALVDQANGRRGRLSVWIRSVAMVPNRVFRKNSTPCRLTTLLFGMIGGTMRTDGGLVGHSRSV